MSLKGKIDTDYKNALKSKDKIQISTYRLILSGIKDLDISNRSGPNKKDTDDGDIKKLLKKMIKQRSESIDIYKKNNRKDLLEVEQKESEILSGYLPKQLSEEEITSFQLEKTDMDKMCNRVCEIIAGYENNGTLQSELWKKLKLSSRDGSRLALKLERMGMITREKILEKERWTYKLIIKKIPINTKSIEGSPCLTCPVEAKCSLDGEVSPKTCQWIEDWVMIELKNK